MKTLTWAVVTATGTVVALRAEQTNVTLSGRALAQEAFEKNRELKFYEAEPRAAKAGENRCALAQSRDQQHRRPQRRSRIGHDGRRCRLVLLGHATVRVARPVDTKKETLAAAAEFQLRTGLEQPLAILTEGESQ